MIVGSRLDIFVCVHHFSNVCQTFVLVFVVYEQQQKKRKRKEEIKLLVIAIVILAKVILSAVYHV